MIDEDTYGMIPSAKIESCENAPPVNKFIMPKMPPSPDCSK